MFWLSVGGQEKERKGIKLIFGKVLKAGHFNMLGVTIILVQGVFA